MRKIVIRALKNDFRSDEKHASKVCLPIIASNTPGTLRIDNKKIYDLIDFP